jgi:hypothetical protein
MPVNDMFYVLLGYDPESAGVAVGTGVGVGLGDGTGGAAGVFGRVLPQAEILHLGLA